MLGDDESGDESDDSEAPNAPAPAPDAVLGCRDAVRDAADAALGFCGEARLQRDAAARGLPEAPAPAALELLLALCRPCLSLLGLLAAELDEDETGDDDGDGDGLALHARLAELRPFVDDLVAADRGGAGSGSGGAVDRVGSSRQPTARPPAHMSPGGNSASHVERDT